MYLSQREAVILGELLQRNQALTLEEILHLLKVSRRTVYRELANLEASLEEVGAQLDRSERGEIGLIANEEVKNELKETLGLTVKQQELSTKERQHAILAELLRNDSPISMAHFLEEYLISNTTFFADIKHLETRMTHLPLEITRNRGYQITGPESQKRLLLANTLSLEINDYQFFHLEQFTTEEVYFLRFLDRFFLEKAQTVVLDQVVPLLENLSDRKIKYLVLLLTVSMERIGKGERLAESDYSQNMDKKYLKLAKKVFYQLATNTKQLYSIQEILFFAQLIDTFSSSYEADFFEDDFDLKQAFQVKQLIDKVSQTLEIDFFADSQLYKMLLTHLFATLSKGILKEQELNNPVLEKVMEQYQELAFALRQVVPQVFPDQAFSEEEIAYLVLHFANSLEKNPKIMAVDVAGISPSGLASTSMMERRLRKNFPFIHEVTFFRMADLRKENHLDAYDLVLSTTVLPGYPGKYLLVSPLLLEEEIEQIRQAFQKIDYSKKALPVEKKEERSSAENYQHFLNYLANIQDFLARFFIQTLDNTDEMHQTIKRAVQQLDQKLVTDAQIVSQKLNQRLQQAPIGLPKTNMALFHAADQSIQAPIFVIFDLTTPLEILAMDKQPMVLKRMLLMLAPAPMDDATAKLLGKVSGAIIMNDLNLEIFNSGNQEIIYQLLANLSIEEMKGESQHV